MATSASQGLSDHSRAMLIGAAGVAIILLGVGSALVPAADRLKGSAVIGGLLLVSGLIELSPAACGAESGPMPWPPAA